MSWNRKLWGVELRGLEAKPLPLGLGWGSDPEIARRIPYAGEPSRLWLWTTREPAVEWARKERAKYAGRSDVCASWRFMVVRVLETVKRVKN